MHVTNDREVARDITRGRLLKACFMRLCATWDVDVLIVSSRGTDAGSMRPDLTVQFEKKEVLGACGRSEDRSSCRCWRSY